MQEAKLLNFALQSVIKCKVILEPVLIAKDLRDGFFFHSALSADIPVTIIMAQVTDVIVTNL